MNENRVLISGAAGFVGANLIRQLQPFDCEIHCLVREHSNLWRIKDVLPRIKVHICTLDDDAGLRKIVSGINPDVVYHLAVAREIDISAQRLNTVKTNINGTVSLLEAASKSECKKFIYAGSSTVYGSNTLPIKENTAPNPADLYGSTKAAASQLIRQYANLTELSLVELRVFRCYGYWEPFERLIPTVILKALQDQTVDLTPPGTGRDWVFIEDVVDAFVKAAQTDTGNWDLFNIGSGCLRYNEEIVALIERHLNKKIRVHSGQYPPRLADKELRIASIQKAEAILGWRPEHDLSAGLAKTTDWVLAHQDACRTAPLTMDEK